MSDRAAARGFQAALTALSFAALSLLSAGPAKAQAVAFQPVVTPFPSGVTLPVTPVVSDDRRYVRLSLAPQFTSLDGVDPFLVPAAVSGGGGNLGGLGGLGGGRFAAGMGGVVEPGIAPGALAGGPMGGGFLAPDAVAVLSGAAGPFTRPKLSATMGGDMRAPRAKAPRTKRPARGLKRR